jgi:hypothetical protein
LAVNDEGQGAIAAHVGLARSIKPLFRAIGFKRSLLIGKVSVKDNDSLFRLVFRRLYSGYRFEAIYRVDENEMSSIKTQL